MDSGKYAAVSENDIIWPKIVWHKNVRIECTKGSKKCEREIKTGRFIQTWQIELFNI